MRNSATAAAARRSGNAKINGISLLTLVFERQQPMTQLLGTSGLEEKYFPQECQRFHSRYVSSTSPRRSSSINQ